MKFAFVVEVEVKNDEATREAGEHDLAIMLMQCLEDNRLKHIPWVLMEHYTRVELVEE